MNELGGNNFFILLLKKRGHRGRFVMHTQTEKIYYDLAIACGHGGPLGEAQPHVNELSRLRYEPYNV